MKVKVHESNGILNGNPLTVGVNGTITDIIVGEVCEVDRTTVEVIANAGYKIEEVN